MKKLLVTFIFGVLVLFSTTAFAKGSFSLKLGANPDTGEQVSILGLSVYEPVPLFGIPLGYNGWVGGGLYENTDTNWVKTSQEVETYVGPMAIGVGGSFEKSPYVEDSDKTLLYATFKYTIWK